MPDHQLDLTNRASSLGGDSIGVSEFLQLHLAHGGERHIEVARNGRGATTCRFHKTANHVGLARCRLGHRTNVGEHIIAHTRFQVDVAHQGAELKLSGNRHWIIVVVAFTKVSIHPSFHLVYWSIPSRVYRDDHHCTGLSREKSVQANGSAAA